MGYVVIEPFSDMSDNSREYRVGDVYPRYGLPVNEDRLRELSGSENRLGRPLIKKNEESNIADGGEEKEPVQSQPEPLKRGRKSRKESNEETNVEENPETETE